jgi:PAS domain S-box-containing protein
LAKSEDFTLALEEVINLIDDNVAVLDLEWRFLFVNDATLKLNGLTREEVLGKTYGEILPGLVGTPIDKALQQAYETHGNVTVEQQNPGNGRWYRIEVIPAATSIILHSADITESKRTGALNQQLMRSLDSINDPIFIMDRKLRYLFINATAAKFVGRDREELLGRNIWEMSPWLRDTNFGRACLKAIDNLNLLRSKTTTSPATAG